jgi:hypothetical protein
MSAYLPDDSYYYADHPGSPFYRTGARDIRIAAKVDAEIVHIDAIRRIMERARSEIGTELRMMDMDICESVVTDLSNMLDDLPDASALRDHIERSRTGWDE